MTTGAKGAVIDASVAVKWYLPDEDHHEQANQLLIHLSSGQAVLAAPVHIRYEVTSAIMAANRRRDPRISREAAEQAIAEFLATAITTYYTAQLTLDAVPLAYHYSIALYDALYLASAQMLALPLITADRQLYQRIQHLPHVVWLGDYAPQAPREGSREL